MTDSKKESVSVEESISSEELAQLALDCGFDTSCCYDLDDIKKLFQFRVQDLRDDLQMHARVADKIASEKLTLAQDKTELLEALERLVNQYHRRIEASSFETGFAREVIAKIRGRG